MLGRWAATGRVAIRTLKASLEKGIKYEETNMELKSHDSAICWLYCFFYNAYKLRCAEIRMETVNSDERYGGWGGLLAATSRARRGKTKMQVRAEDNNNLTTVFMRALTMGTSHFSHPYSIDRAGDDLR